MAIRNDLMQRATTNQRFGKSEKLCSRKIIGSLIESGTSIYTSLFRIIFLINPAPLPAPVQIAFSVPKRGFRHAVARNLLKRRMREAYRKNKTPLWEKLENLQSTMAVMIVYRQNVLADFNAVETAMTDAINKLTVATGKNAL
jgi:ribonuclease P protein component